MTSSLTHGIVTHTTERSTDYLYRISIKCLVRNPDGQVLVVKETGRSYWDLPGGGMDHGESIRDAIAREMFEEVTLNGDFTYRIVAIDEPKLLDAHNFWQLRLVFEIIPEAFDFRPGADCDELMFVDPFNFKGAANRAEAFIFDCCKN